MKLDKTERRVLGALIEKRLTTPDAYPLTLKALVAACNQKSNRDPVLEIQDFEVEGCLRGLRPKGLAIQHERDTGRVVRFSEKLGEALGTTRPELAILAELLLRGPQTAPELLRRCARMADYDGVGEVDDILRDLSGRGFVCVMARASGQRHNRWEHLLAPDDETCDLGPMEEETLDGISLEFDTAEMPAEMAQPAVPVPTAADPADLEALTSALDALRAEVTSLRERVDRLELGG